MDSQNFIQWVISRGVYIHLDVMVEPSQLGGLGLVGKSEIRADSIVLRIPQLFTFDLNTLLELTSVMKDSDKSGMVTRVINTVLASGPNFTETAIVRSYVWGLRILHNLSRSSTLSVEGLDHIDQYLDILASTEILDVNTEEDDPDHLIQMQIKEKRKVKAEYDDLVDKLAEARSCLSFTEAFHLHQAVKSRVLEIPHAIEDVERPHTSDGEDEEEEESEDFTTNVTLVPVLDFANHSHQNNAVFDVDRETGEVLLRTLRSINEGEEICISYSPTKSLHVFFRTYGFIPSSPGIYKWKIPHLSEIIGEQFGTAEKYDLIARWLHIYPYLNILVSSSGVVSLDLADFRLPLLMIPGLQYDSTWPQKVNTAELSHMYQGDNEEIIAQLRKQEETSEVVYASATAYGVTWKGKDVMIDNLIEQACELSEDAVNELIQSVIPVLQSAIKRSIEEDEEIAKRHDSTVLNSYYAFKKRVLEKVQELEFEDYMRMIEEGVYDIED